MSIGKTPGSLRGIEYAVYNAIAQYPDVATAELYPLLRGYDQSDVRAAVRRLKSMDLIYRSAIGNTHCNSWRVKQ